MRAFPVSMMEDHDQAYFFWKKQGLKGFTLLHIDAHLDFGWLPELDWQQLPTISFSQLPALQSQLLLNPFITSKEKLLNIGNFICSAIRDGIVRRLFWIVPEPTLNCLRGNYFLQKQIKQILRLKKTDTGSFLIKQRSINFRLAGVEVTVCGLSDFCYVEEPVLLDIDVDFLVTGYIWNDVDPCRIPWIYPDQLYELVSKKISQIEALTIAYSVEGGFTPLKFKFLGDYLRLYFTEDFSKEDEDSLERRKEAIYLEEQEQYDKAEAIYEELLKINPKDASIYFALYLLNLNSHIADITKARNYFYRAIQIDPTYSTEYNNYGILYARNGRYSQAKKYYQRFLEMCPTNASCWEGLGFIALRERDYTASLRFFKKSLEYDSQRLASQLGVAIIHFYQGVLDKAEEMLFSLKEKLTDNFEIYWWLARIAHKKGLNKQAINYYKKAVLTGGEGVAVHWYLASLYLKEKNFFRVTEELSRIIQQI